MYCNEENKGVRVSQKRIEEEVIETIAFVLDRDAGDIDLGHSLIDDLEMDSFGAVELTFALKDKFGIEIPQEDLKGIVTVNDIVQYILRIRG